MNRVREKVLENKKPYVDFSEHKDLIAIVVGDSYYTYDADNDVEMESDFSEVVAVTEKDWLFKSMIDDDNIENPLDYLQNVYTYDDSFAWFESAKINGKVVAVEFC